MRVLDTFHIKGHGCVAVVKLGEQKVIIGTLLRRKSDGIEVRVRGIEHHAILRQPRSGDTVGLLVSPELSKDDELEIVA